jgi:AcrR family transcriptional regulator
MNIHSVPANTATATVDDKREAILDAALTLFTERTFDGTAVPLIADTAGVAAGTIYRYFPSKEALVNALYRRWKGEMRAAIRDGIATASTTREQFGGIWRGLWRFAADHPLAITFLETHHHAAYLDDESHALGAEIEAESAAFIRQAQVKGELRDSEPGVIIALVFGAFTGLVKKAGSGGLVFDEDVVRQTEEIMWSAVVGSTPNG